MILADFWVFLNIILALLISIPAINLFTHGTHITVAHSMGTTIGINTFILLSSITYIFNTEFSFTESTIRKLKKAIQVFHISFIFFWTTLLLMGLKKSIWLFGNSIETFSKFQESQRFLTIAFVFFGLIMLTELGIIVTQLIKTYRRKQIKTN